MSETKFLLRDARDQINLELRKVSRRVSNRVYTELENAVLTFAEDDIQIDISSEAVRKRLVQAVKDLEAIDGFRD